MLNINKKILIVLTGPTAVGKTDLSIDIAKNFNTEIISADSRQFFKELKIGTAPPSDDDLKKVKHHFIGNLSITENYNIGKYEIDALNCINNIFNKNNYAVLTGGSGLYLDVVCNGMSVLPSADEDIRNEIDAIFNTGGIEALKVKLKELDEEYYKIVDLNNYKRLMRAIEVCLVTGEKYSELRKNKPQEREFKIIKFCLNRDRNELYERIDKRVDLMIENGLIDEAKSFINFRNYNSLNTVGYKELFPFFDGIYDINEAIRLIKRNSRRFAKRQLTWFRKDNSYIWVNPSEIEKIIETIEDF